MNSLKRMLTAASEEPPPEYTGKRRQPVAPMPEPEYKPSRPPVSRMRQAAAEAAQHVDDLEQQVMALNDELHKQQKDFTDEIASRKANEQFLSLTVSELKLDRERPTLQRDGALQELGEIKGRLSAVAGMMIDVLTPPKRQEEHAAAEMIGEQAVADALEPTEQPERKGP